MNSSQLATSRKGLKSSIRVFATNLVLFAALSISIEHAVANISLRAPNGKYVSIRNGGNSVISAVGANVGPWEDMTRRDVNGGFLQAGDFVSFKSSGGFFLTAVGGGGGQLVATQTTEGTNEQFTLVKLNGTGTLTTGDQVAVKSGNGKYLTVGASDILNVTGSTIGAAQTFVLGLAFRPQTYANPMNLVYGEFGSGTRTGADPQIVPFKGKYYLFDSRFKTMARGYHVSTDLVNWTFVPFDAATVAVILQKGGTNPPEVEIVAPGAFTDGQYIYYMRSFGKTVVRTDTPDSGTWATYSTSANGSYDTAFYWESGALYELSGGASTYLAQFNLSTFSPTSGTSHEQTTRTDTPTALANSPYGLHLGHLEYQQGTDAWRTNWDLANAVDTARLWPIFDSYATYASLTPAQQATWQSDGKYSMNCSQEGAWMTRNPINGKYMLQNSSPGTYGEWYSDAVYSSVAINGPYTLEPYATLSMKVGGFVNGAGHGGTFQDFSGNWWRVVTMYINGERRIGLFPAGFDAQGRMFTQTYLGDYPIAMPTGLKTPSTTSSLAGNGWFVISKGRTCTASSTQGSNTPNLAADENIRTWWSATTGNASEWFQMDLGASVTINAVQVNFAEQSCQVNAAEDYHAYKLLSSTDGVTWTTFADKSTNTTSVAHDYVPLSEALYARYIRVQNVHTAKLGKFALRDLRVFGKGSGAAPNAVTNFTATRRASDQREVTFTWTPTSNTLGYIVNYGVSADALYLSVQYPNPTAGQLSISSLNRNNARYYYRIDAYNAVGVTTGTVISDP